VLIGNEYETGARITELEGYLKSKVITYAKHVAIFRK